MLDCCTDRGSIWYLSQPEETVTVLCRAPLDGTDSELLPEYQPPVVSETPAAGCWGPILGGDGELWIWEQFLLPSDGSGYQHLYRLRQLDPDTGKELGAVDITTVMEGMDTMSLGGLVVDEAGTVFLADKSHVAAVDEQGQVLYTLKANMPRTATSGGAGGTLARLYADIAAGYCPDILDASVPLNTLAKQDVLEDLWPWIDSDPDISRDGLMVHVLECLEVDGKLPQVCSGFKIETAVASAAVAGDRTGWTMEEMLDAFGGEMPEFYFARNDDLNLIYTMFHRFDRKAVLYELVNMNLSRFVNMETGECSFDGDDFKSLLQLAGSGEEVPETGLDLDDPYISMDLGISGTDSAILSGIEQCRVFPWEGKSLLYARTLSETKDLVIDDVLFGGREPLTDYDQRLWDADIIYDYGTSPYSGDELIRTRYFTMEDYPVGWSANGFTKIECERLGVGKSLAADYQVDAADRNIYASYVGFPSASGAGSSFTIRQSMGISASSAAKEGAWAFVRGLLLPNGNATGFLTVTGEPFNFDGFPVNRETFDELMLIGGMAYWTDPYTGEFFEDANGDPVEFSPTALGVGAPGDIVLMAYLFAPSEAQLERFWRLYESTEQITGRNDALLDIILEQADVYFAGDKSLDETVRLVRNRAQLYVNENR